MIRVLYAPSRARGAARLSEARVKRVAEVVSKAIRVKGEKTVSVTLIDGPTMQRINAEYRGKDAVTDVLAFPYDSQSIGELDGEVLICPSRAREQALEDGRTVDAEMVELLIHGLLHVFGYDHIKPKDAKKMLPLQAQILRRCL